MTCVHKRLSKFYTNIFRQEGYLISFGFSHYPLLSFLKVLLTCLHQIEKSTVMCQIGGQFLYNYTGNIEGLAWILKQLKWQALKITFF